MLPFYTELSCKYCKKLITHKIYPSVVTSLGKYICIVKNKRYCVCSVCSHDEYRMLEEINKNTKCKEPEKYKNRKKKTGTIIKKLPKPQ